MPLKIRRSRRARADQDAIWSYIATDNMAAADTQIDRIDAAFHRLAEYPDAGRNRPDIEPTIRALPVDNYLIFYRVMAETLDIVSIVHAARDIKRDTVL